MTHYYCFKMYSNLFNFIHENDGLHVFLKSLHTASVKSRSSFTAGPGSFFSSPECKVLRVSYCDHSPSVSVCCPSVLRLSVRSHFYTLASTNIKQSVPNLVKMYGGIRSRMSSIMDLIA